MIQYFYDEEGGYLVAFDKEAQTVRVLEYVGEVEFESEEAEPEAEVEPKAATPKGKAKGQGKGKNKCSLCGKAGHSRRTCPTGGRPAKPEGTAEWQDLGEVGAPIKKISRMTFGRVKISQEHEIPAATVASNLDEPIGEVIKAYEANTYDQYSKS